MLRTRKQRVVRMRRRERAGVLVTGLGTYWGSRIAQQLERSTGVEIVVGVDTREPRLPLEKHRVRARRLVLLDPPPHRAGDARSTRSCTPTSSSTPTGISGRTLHEINVIGTMNLLAAAGAAGQPRPQGRS